MKGTIDFRYDSTHDVVIATPHWKIETEEDVLGWYQQYERYMARFGRRMDFVVVLDDFEVVPAIGARWGEFRARVHQNFTRYNYRVHSSRTVKLFVHTSGARYNVGTQEAATIEDGIAGILAERAAAAAKPGS